MLESKCESEKIKDYAHHSPFVFPFLQELAMHLKIDHLKKISTWTSDEINELAMLLRLDDLHMKVRSGDVFSQHIHALFFFFHPTLILIFKTLSHTHTHVHTKPKHIHNTHTTHTHTTQRRRNRSSFRYSATTAATSAKSSRPSTPPCSDSKLNCRTV